MELTTVITRDGRKVPFEVLEKYIITKGVQWRTGTIDLYAVYSPAPFYYLRITCGY